MQWVICKRVFPAESEAQSKGNIYSRSISIGKHAFPERGWYNVKSIYLQLFPATWEMRSANVCFPAQKDTGSTGNTECRSIFIGKTCIPLNANPRTREPFVCKRFPQCAKCVMETYVWWVKIEAGSTNCMNFRSIIIGERSFPERWFQNAKSICLQTFPMPRVLFFVWRLPIFPEMIFILCLLTILFRRSGIWDSIYPLPFNDIALAIPRLEMRKYLPPFI